MPWLNNSKPSQIGPQKVQLALENAFIQRLPAEVICKPIRQLCARYSLSPDDLSKVLFCFRSPRPGADDPLLFDYVETLLDQKLVDANNLLAALLQTSRFSKEAASHHSDEPCSGLPTCEERVFTMLMQKHATGALTVERSNLHDLALALARWLHTVTEYEMGKQLTEGALHVIDVFSGNMYDALTSLVLTVLSNTAFRSVTKQPWWKKRRATLVTEMQNFDAHVLQWMQQPSLAGRLQILSTFPPFLETDDEGNPIFTDAQILQFIQDLPITNSRAGLYIWLAACLYSRPYTDDSSMIMYLQARYNGNIQALVVGLLTASFDSLTNALRRRESQQSVQAGKSFVCNKLPLLLSIISGGLATASSVEAFIQLALATISMDPLPPISAGATEVGDQLKASRRDFLQACALHGVISDHTVTAILQTSTGSPKASKYTKESLMAKYTKGAETMEPLIAELDAMQGNAGAISTFLVQTINTLCINSDTISLKVLCNMLFKRIASVDIILQHTNVTALLLPLCNQMNNWTHDQEQAEFTSAYEEFASIMLFVLAVVHRFGLTTTDLGLQGHDSFVARMLRETPMSRIPGNLTDEQSTQLSTWIEGLYATDDQGEISGISDETMRGCPPQAFYELVPTLFEQSVLACKSGALSVKALQGGLEFLGMPFLLPSLVLGLGWLTQHSWEDHDDSEILLQVLEKALKPSSDSPETQAMHKVILGIVADPLHRSLQSLALKKPGKKVSALMSTLKPFLDQTRNASGSRTEAEHWMAEGEGGMSAVLRNVIREQVAWVTDIGPTPPPRYTHRLYTVARETFGADMVLDTVISELKEQTKRGNGSYAIDICTALVSAPTSSSSVEVTVFPSSDSNTAEESPSVREVLNLRSRNLQRLLKTSAAEAESLVRLRRRVDAQLVVTQMPQVHLPLPLQNQATDQLMADLGLGDENLVATVTQDAAMKPGADADFDNADLAAVLDHPIDMTDATVQDLANLSSDPNALATDPTQNIFDDLGMQLPESLSQMVNAEGGAADPNAEDDIFAELDMSNIEDFNF